MKRALFTLSTLLATMPAFSQISGSNVYWVGHSLISHTYGYDATTQNLIHVFGELSTSQGKTYGYHQHTTPGAPIGWNWGANPTAWGDIQTVIQPLINSSDPNYGTYDVMVVTEGVELSRSYQYWASSFYARKFFGAGLNSNPNMRTFLYESWHHYNASDDVSRPEYGPMSTFNWDQYMTDIRSVWNDIQDEASDPTMTQNDPGYVYQGSGTDPGDYVGLIDVCLIPTGEVLQNVLNRLEANDPGDDWSYNGGTLTGMDFFENPLANYPADTVTTVHAGDPVDDIHPSNVLVYLNALTHYAVIYIEEPNNLPALNGVPNNIATIFKEEVWNTVINNERTCIIVTGTEELEKTHLKISPNPVQDILTLKIQNELPYKIVNLLGEEMLSGTGKTIDVQELPEGMYIVQVGNASTKFMKR